MTQQNSTTANGNNKGTGAARRAQAKASKFTAIAGGKAVRKAKSDMDSLISESTKAVEEAFSSSSKEIKKAQADAIEISIESFENFSKSSEAALKNLDKFFDIGKDAAEALTETAEISAEITQSLSTEAAEIANSIIAEQFKALEGFLACKTVSDLFELQSNYVKNTADVVFENSIKLTELSMKYSDAVQPLNKAATKAGAKLTKALSQK